jgi:hypothetical protein
VPRQPFLDEFQEALLWQNPSLVANWLLDYDVESERRRKPSNARRRHSAIARYLQRYTTKNDTAGFFRPVAWAGVDPTKARRPPLMATALGSARLTMGQLLARQVRDQLEWQLQREAAFRKEFCAEAEESARLRAAEEDARLVASVSADD